MFEIPKYPMMTDEELAGRLEYRRFCDWEFDTNVETLARKGAEWKFLNFAAASSQANFIGDRLLRTAKGVLKITWMDVHVDYVMLGRLVPSNFYKRTSTVNAKAFPQSGFRDQNVAASPGAGLVQFRPGTVLLMPAKIKNHAQCHPAFFDRTQRLEDYLPRTVDVEMTGIVFDPPSDETTTVDLSAPPLNASAVTEIRGHNLCPLVEPRPGSTPPYGIWYAAYGRKPGSSTPFTSQTQLLYQYSDFEKLFAPAESL
jgi:hypothetical protein